jgi:hypothetical protein
MVTMTQSYPACWLPSGPFTGSIANRPVSSVKQIAYRLNAKPFGLGNVFDLFALRTATDKVSGHFARYLGQPMTVFSASAQAAFRNFVSAIVGSGAKPKVVRINAGWRVASVQDMKLARFSNVKRVGEAVRQNRTLFSAAPEASVSGPVNGRAPKPTACHGVMVNVRHKAINAVHRITVSIQMATVK